MWKNAPHTKAAIAIQIIWFLGTISMLKQIMIARITPIKSASIKTVKKVFISFKKRNFNFLVINGKYKKDIFRTNRRTHWYV